MAGRQQHPSGTITDYGTLADKLTSTNVYAAVGVVPVNLFKTKRVRFRAVTNDLLLEVLGSLDGGVTYDISLETNIAVSVGTDVLKAYTDAVTDIKVNVKPAVNGVHGTVSTWWFGANW